ncbi:hypothetical protein RDI58_024728 [Solanum bulbocastanum]|uniref:Uncharacterized protein n=1 Tax=Solanum bulbocastanum TaxID=147425 RepID=A0AAN8SY65_SOLBU
MDFCDQEILGNGMPSSDPYPHEVMH